VKELFLYNASPVKGTTTYLKLSGEKTSDIALGNNNFSNVKVAIEKSKEVPGKIRVISGDSGQ